MIPLFDLAPVRRFAVVNYGLIATNFVVWFWELGSRGARIDHYAFYPCAVDGPCVGAARDHIPWPESVLSSMFMHASWVHILGNMLFLWIFGNNVEDALGRVRYFVFYIAGGYAAAFTQTWLTIHYAGVGAASVPNVGASGAIAAVLGAYLILLPHARVVTLLFGFLPVPLSAFIVLGVWFVLQLLQANFSITHPGAGGGVAFGAHIGGFLFGMLFVRAFQTRPPLAARR